MVIIMVIIIMAIIIIIPIIPIITWQASGVYCRERPRARNTSSKVSPNFSKLTCTGSERAWVTAEVTTRIE
jgi:hypothetical protein